MKIGPNKPKSALANENNNNQSFLLLLLFFWYCSMFSQRENYISFISQGSHFDNKRKKNTFLNDCFRFYIYCLSQGIEGQRCTQMKCWNTRIDLPNTLQPLKFTWLYVNVNVNIIISWSISGVLWKYGMKFRNYLWKQKRRNARKYLRNLFWRCLKAARKAEMSSNKRTKLCIWHKKLMDVIYNHLLMMSWFSRLLANLFAVIKTRQTRPKICALFQNILSVSNNSK